MRQISRYQDDSGNTILSFTESINAWRNKTTALNKMPPKLGIEAACRTCGGWGEKYT